MNGKYLSHLLFLIVSVLGSLYLAVEAVFLSQGRSICAGEGCTVVAQYSRFGDLAFVLAGLVVMVALAAAAATTMRKERPLVEAMTDGILIAALSAEGFLGGYQFFWLGTVCTFCISIFGLFVMLGLLRFAAGRRGVVAGFIALAAVMLLFLAVLPAGAPPLPADAKLVLFYSTECRHCAEIRTELEASGLEVTHLLSKEYSPTLRGLGIEEVPTLLVNGPYERMLLTGTRAIRGYLASCGTRTTPPGAALKGGPPGGKAEGRPTTAPPAGKSFELFTAPGGPGSILNAPSDDGLCKEQQKCD